MSDQLEPDQEMTESACAAQALAPSQGRQKQSRTAEITVEFNQVVVIRKPEGLTIMWCPVCEERVNMITTEAAAILSNSTRALSTAGLISARFTSPKHQTGWRSSVSTLC